MDIFHRMSKVSDKSCKVNKTTHFILSKVFFENRAVYEIVWKNMAQQDKHGRQYNMAPAQLHAG